MRTSSSKQLKQTYPFMILICFPSNVHIGMLSAYNVNIKIHSHRSLYNQHLQKCRQRPNPLFNQSDMHFHDCIRAKNSSHVFYIKR